MYRIIPFSLTLLATIWSCEKESNPNIQSPNPPEPPISQNDIFECYTASQKDSLQVHDYLLGNWQWTFITCSYNPEDANSATYADLSLRFDVDNTMAIFRNGVKTQSLYWKMEPTRDGSFSGSVAFFEIQTNPPHPLLRGTFLYCQDILKLYMSDDGGCDNFFIRK